MLDAVGEMGASDGPVDEADATGEWDNGSQWESGTEGDGSLHSHEDAPCVNRISVTDILSEPEDDDRVYVRAVREKVVAMLKENPSRAAMHPKIERPRHGKAHESCLHRVQNSIFLMQKLYENGSEKYKYHLCFPITNFSIES